MPHNPYETVENIEELAQRLMLLGVVKVLKHDTLMFDYDPRLQIKAFSYQSTFHVF
jgi:hypothetical protein